MNTFLQDLRYAARQLRRSPGFTIVAVLTLALGIGANTSIFSVVDSVLLRPLPFADQGKLVQIQAESPFPKGWIREFQKRAQSFSSVSGYTLNSEYNVAGSGASDRALGSTVSTNLFDTLGIRPTLGRFFSPAEQQVGQDRVAVLSYAFWQQHFGSDPNIIGHNVLIDGVDREIIGVAPRGIHFPDSETQFWIPIAFNPGDPLDAWADSNNFNKRAIGRLKDGVQPGQAQAQLRILQPQMLTSFPWRMPDNWAADVTVVPLLQSVVGDSGPKLLLLLGAVGLVLLIACANVANLMLARAASRQREMAVRSALGASIPRIVRQMLTESALLAVISGVFGVLLAALSLRALKLVLPPGTPRLANVSLHGDVFLFAAGVSLLTGILTGLAPAWNASNKDLQSALRSNETSIFGAAGRFRISRLLAIGQIALAVVVITTAGVMLRSLYRLSNVDPGFRTSKTISAQVSLDRKACEQSGRCTAFFQTFLDRAQGLPGVQNVALVDILPMTGFDESYVFDAQDHPRAARQPANVASTRTVSPSYFTLMGIHLVRGRFFTDSDSSGASRAIIVNQSLAKKLWPNQDPIGKHMIAVSREASPGVLNPDSAATIVGVVADTHHQALDQDSGWETYLPLSINNEKPVMHVLVRANASTSDVAASLRRLVEETNPSAPVTKVETLDEVVAASTAAPRSLTMLLLAFAALAMGVGTVGVYSLISYTVSWRNREIGLRLALGANRRQIAMLIVRQSLLLTLTGSAVGVAGAVAVARLMRSFLFGTSPTDPLTYAMIPVLLGGLALIAAWAPARRATRVDPMRALRNN
jgi:putative ABC transport system permease protein